MALQSRTTERAAKRSRREPAGFKLLKIAESKLREGNVRDALKLFGTIVRRYPPSLERLAAQSYLRTA